jgi:hypothetical protein
MKRSCHRLLSAVVASALIITPSLPAQAAVIDAVMDSRALAATVSGPVIPLSERIQGLQTQTALTGIIATPAALEKLPAESPLATNLLIAPLRARSWRGIDDRVGPSRGGESRRGGAPPSRRGSNCVSDRF